MRYRSRQLALKFVLVWVAALFVSLASACSDDSSEGDSTMCREDNECASDEVCLSGVCVVQGQAYCSTAGDCPTGPYECVDKVCKRTDFDTGVDSGNSDAGTERDTNPPRDTSGGDAQPGAPSVESVTPAPGSTGVGLDTPIEVTFSEPMDPFTITFYSIQLRDTNNRDVEISVAYDEASRTATITPQSGLRQASGYRIKVESIARDTDGYGVDPEFESSFFTEYVEPAEHTNVAQTFAPVIYQGIADTEGAGVNGDIPTLVTFDGNTDAADNGANSRREQTETSAYVYYHVTESPQYYFLHYILYYPSRLDASDQSRAEHDFAGAVLVVDKQSNELLVAEGVQLLESGEETLSYKPTGSPISLPGGGSVGNTHLTTFDASLLEDGTHYPMYVPGGVHETCHWYKSGQNGRCLHNPEEFRGGDSSGVVLRHGDTAQTFAQATLDDSTGHLEMIYELVPFGETLWAMRGSYESDGLFDVPFVYEPAGTERPAGYTPQQDHVLPKRLQSETTTSFGRMPFLWLPNPGYNNEGQWLMDPVYILPNRYNFGGTVSTDYCHNFFFDIDHRTDGAVPGCGSN